MNDFVGRHSELVVPDRYVLDSDPMTGNPSLPPSYVRYNLNVFADRFRHSSVLSISTEPIIPAPKRWGDGTTYLTLRLFVGTTRVASHQKCRTLSIQLLP